MQRLMAIAFHRLSSQKIAYRNARATACACPVVTAAPTTTTISSVSRDFSPDYNMVSQHGTVVRYGVVLFSAARSIEG